MFRIQDFASWLSHKLAYTAERDRRPTLYSRDTGPICYEAELFRDEEGLNDFIHSLLSSGLEWYWASARQYDVLDEYKGWDLPEIRALTKLNADNSTLLHRDFLEEDIDYSKRGLEILGVAGTTITIGGVAIRKAIDYFLTDQDSAIKVVINRICDTAPLYIFVPQKPAAELANLLNRWNLGKDNVAKTRAYKRLNLAKLEDMKEGIIKLAIPDPDQ